MKSAVEVFVELDFENKSTNKHDFFYEMASYLYNNNIVKEDVDVINKALLDREKLGTTGFEDGLAIPHGIILGLEKSKIIYLRLNNQVEWGSLDSLPVRFVFILLIPKDSETNEHLQIISHLAYNLMDKDYQKKLKTGASEDAIREVLEKMLLG